MLFARWCKIWEWPWQDRLAKNTSEIYQADKALQVNNLIIFTFLKKMNLILNLSGIFASLAYIVNLTIAGSPTSAGISFFCTAGAFAFFALVNHLCVIKTDFYQSKMLDEPNSKASDAELVSDTSTSSRPSQEKGFSSKFHILEF